MKETIYTIPINESFEVMDGTCPICRLHRQLLEDTLDYVLGPAMMEPDVRERTNKLGFCKKHLERLLQKQKRLPLALVLDTHLQSLTPNPLKWQDTCFVCSRVDNFLAAYYSNMLYLWQKEEDFRAKWKAQTFFCRPHTRGLAEKAKEEFSKKQAALFYADLEERTAKTLSNLSRSLGVFAKSFDHRYSDIPLEEDKEAVQKAIAFMGGDV